MESKNKKRIRKNYHRRNSPSGRGRFETIVLVRNGDSARGYTRHLPLLTQDHSGAHIDTIRWITSCLKIISGIAFLIVISLTFIFLHDFFTQCDYFKAGNISIAGMRRLSEKQIMKQAQIHEGINILSVNLSKARKRLLAHAWIAEAEVRRELPSEIYIKVTEHEPVAILDLGRKFIINANGEIFKEWAASDPDDFPMVSGLNFSDISASDAPRGLPFMAVMEILRMGQQPGSIISNRLIRKIEADREMGITLYAAPTPWVSPEEPGPLRAIKLGYNNYPGKYDRLENIFLYLKENQNLVNIESVDLNNVNHIVVNGIQK
ncbi:FtsQ-type POTRA domain-containing protein [Desulfococcaceae bacterium HSG8]|nr:FtsQ-type POTRA domain-containing protein [Desulfococcaceae bacterium HSG8]